MKAVRRFLVAFMVASQVALPVATVDARGCKGGGCGGGGCYGGGGYYGGCDVQYVEQTVTAYRTEYRQKEVEVTVNRMVSRVVETPYKYTENVPVTVAEKRTVTTYTCQTKTVPTTVTVNVPTWVQETRNVTTYQCVTENVPTTITVNVPTYVPEKRTVTTYTCVPQEVERKVAVCRMVPTQCVDPCTGCARTVCQPVTEWQTVKQTVYTSVPQQQEVTVNVCKWTTEQRTVNRCVTKVVPVTREVTVNVCKWTTQEQTVNRCVTEMVPQTQEVTVNVCKWQAVERSGVNRQTVCEWVPEKVKQTVTECVSVPYQTTVKVPVYASNCNTGCGPVGCR